MLGCQTVFRKIAFDTCSVVTFFAKKIVDTFRYFFHYHILHLCNKKVSKPFGKERFTEKNYAANHFYYNDFLKHYGKGF
jgi:hypothetical protein